MRRLAVALAFLFGAISPSLAAGYCIGDAPPPDKQREPTVRYQVHNVPPEIVHWFCVSHAASPIGMAVACATNHGEDANGDLSFTIVIRNDLSP
jgi:hypothetical protein